MLATSAVYANPATASLPDPYEKLAIKPMHPQSGYPERHVRKRINLPESPPFHVDFDVGTSLCGALLPLVNAHQLGTREFRKIFPAPFPAPSDKFRSLQFELRHLSYGDVLWNGQSRYFFVNETNYNTLYVFKERQVPQYYNLPIENVLHLSPDREVFNINSYQYFKFSQLNFYLTFSPDVPREIELSGYTRLVNVAYAPLNFDLTHKGEKIDDFRKRYLSWVQSYNAELGAFTYIGKIYFYSSPRRDVDGNYYLPERNADGEYDLLFRVPYVIIFHLDGLGHVSPVCSYGRGN